MIGMQTWPNRRAIMLTLAGAALWACPSLRVVAQDAPGQVESDVAAPDSEQAIDEPLARVNEQVITADDLARFLKRRLGGRALRPKAEAAARRAALRHLVDRRIIQEFLIEKGYAPGPTRLQQELKPFQEQAAAAGQDWDAYLASEKMTANQFAFETRWRVGWQDYLTEKMGDEVLVTFYRDHQRQFDGTRLLVDHLLKSHPSETESSGSSAQAELSELRSQVLDGSLAWDQAVQTHSDAPSKNEGGRVGWIDATGPMDPEFTAAALHLDRGQISEPVRTRFGWHLIRCRDVQPGSLGYADAREAVRAAAIKDRFRALVEYQRPKVQVEILADDTINAPPNSGR